MKKIILLGCLLLSACGTSAVNLDPVIQNAPPVALPVVQPMSLNDVQWHVMNAADLKALLTKQGNNIALFSLDAGNYQNLGLNFIEIKRFISEQKELVALLEKIVAQQQGTKPNSSSTVKSN